MVQNFACMSEFASFTVLQPLSNKIATLRYRLPSNKKRKNSAFQMHLLFKIDAAFTLSALSQAKLC